jgi:hypothetical protein
MASQPVPRLGVEKYVNLDTCLDLLFVVMILFSAVGLVYALLRG